MTTFKFPPPPPPPPKATTNDTQEPYSSQRGGHGNNRGERGRDWRGRGHGNNFRGNARGGRGQGRGSRGGNFNGRFSGNSRSGHYSQDRGVHQQSTLYGTTELKDQSYQIPTAIPPSSISEATHRNTTFATHSQHGVPVQPQPNSAAFAQAMAFMSTPAGMQTMAAFASHMASGTQPSQMPLNSSASTLHAFQRSPSPPDSRKRKRQDPYLDLNVSHVSPPAPRQPSKPKPQRAKVAAPPVVPDFGFTLPHTPAAPVSHASNSGDRKPIDKRRVHLGLTSHVGHDAETSDNDDIEEDVDEEAAFSGTAGMVFEYEGQSVSLQTPAEVAAWVRDRRKHFPTRKRIEEKAEQAAAKRADELEFLRKVRGRRLKSHNESVRQGTTQRQEAEKGKMNSKRRESKTTESVSTEGQPSSVREVSVEKKLQTADLGLGYDTDTTSDINESSEFEDSSVVSSSDESSENSDSESEASDSAPEKGSSKAVAPVIKPPPLPPPPKPAGTSTKRVAPEVCPHWEKAGKCKYGDRCRYPHPMKEQKRLGLYERMVEQENEKADRLALDAIKYLGRHGFLG